MRKIMINQAAESPPPSESLSFLNLESLAQVEFTSEHQKHPIQSTLLLTDELEAGWQAACTGEQTIRIVFDQPQTIQHIFLTFDEQQQSRTQEFALFWLMDKEYAYREILRQQFNFSPPDTTLEIEHYEVRLNQLKVLELRIIPDISKGEAYATLKQLRLA
ncbi:MAG: carbohydrate-binding protein [Methylovulum sp.]|nr:carbohydrate-binding protein [Methylovulum sp.]